MNIVIVTTNFLPKNDAEAFCTARFASALSRAGHSVYVVTLQQQQGVRQDVFSAIVDDRIQIITVGYSLTDSYVLSQIRYRCPEREISACSALIRATKKLLHQLDKPILVSRTYSVTSLVVGWHCRKYANKWICHLSDPIPSALWKPFFSFCPPQLKDWVKYRWIYNWIRRGLLDSDGVSVTCPGVVRFYSERYGGAVDNEKFFVVTHIGDTRLSALNDLSFERPKHGKLIVHPGDLYTSRKMDALAEAVRTINAEGLDCTLVHIGDGGLYGTRLQKEFPTAYVRYDRNAELTVAASQVADVLYTTDSITGLPYSPQILSKFVYQLFEDKPILVETSADGMMHQCAVDYPEAGIFWVDRDNLATMTEALKRALSCDVRKIDRSRIRLVFSEKTVAEAFVQKVYSLMIDD